MWLFSPFHLDQTLKHWSISCQNRSLLFTNLLVLVPTAVMAKSFNFNRFKTKIRNFSGKYQVYIISQRWNFPKIVLLHSRHVERLKLRTSFVSFHSVSPRTDCDTTCKFRAFFCQIICSIIFLFSFLLLFFIFAFLSNKSKTQNLPPDIRHVDLRISRALWLYLGSSMCWIINVNEWRWTKLI